MTSDGSVFPSAAAFNEIHMKFCSHFTLEQNIDKQMKKKEWMKREKSIIRPNENGESLKFASSC